MNKSIKQKIIYTASFLFAAVLVNTSCKKEYVNPSAASTGSVTKSVDALINLAAGVQRRYTIGRQSPIYNTPVAGGYSVFALRTTNTGNVAETELEGGRAAINPNNSMVSSLWSQCLLGKNECEIILDNLSTATDAGDRVGLKAYATIFYALNVGALSQFYQSVPLKIENNASFSSRADALLSIVQKLESVNTDLASTNPSAKFLGKVPAGIDIKNTVKALLARFYNMHSMVSGTYNSTSGGLAVSYAQASSQTIKSEFRFSTLTTNSFGENALGANVFAAVDSTLGLRNGLAPVPASTDPRVGFYIRKVGGNLLMNAFGLTNIVSIPVYLPGEMNLIVAENLARQGAFLSSKTALDLVRTKVTDIYGIGANQLAYSGTLSTTDLLTDIYKQRRLELFLSGMELEDSRRFGRVAPVLAPAPINPNAERNRNFYPFPLTERSNNTNTPADPAI